MDIYPVMAVFDNIGDIKTAVIGLVTVVIIGWLASKIIRDDTRSAYSALPLVGIVLILATAAGAVFFRDTTLEILKFFLGTGG